MGIEFTGEITLPDLADVLKNQFYCPNCENKLNTIDPRSTLELYKRRQHRRKFIRTHGEKQFKEVISILKKTAEQLNNDQPLDWFLLQCKNCFRFVAVKAQKLADFLMEKSLTNEWTDQSQITLKNQQLMILG